MRSLPSALVLLTAAAASLAVSSTLAQPPAPSAGAGDLIVVLEKDSARARLIDVNTGATVGTMPTGPFPHEVTASPDGRLAVVADYGTGPQAGRTLTVLDLPGRRVARTIDLGEYRRPHGIEWLPGPGSRVAVTVEQNQALLIVDVAAGRVERAVRTGQEGTHMVALGRDGRAYTANMGSGSVSLLNLDDGAMVRTGAAGRSPEAIAVRPAARPDGRREVWTADRQLNRVTVLDATTLDSLAAFPSGRWPNRLQFTPDGRLALVSNAADGTVTVYDAAARRLTATIPMGDGPSGSPSAMNPTGRSAMPLGILMAPDGRRAWVALNAAGVLAEVALPEGRVVRRLAAGAGPDGMAYAAARR